MKRILILTLAFISLFSMASAISLDELCSNTYRYKHVHTGPLSDEYIDNTSINVVSNTPPYYVINADAYAVYYDTNTISQYSNAYHLDYSRSLNRLIPLYGDDSASGVAEWKQDSGIKWEPRGIAVFGFDGSTIIPYTSAASLAPMPTSLEPAAPMSPAYMAGMYVFYEAFDIYFNPPMRQQMF
ncbi:MAG: hypothetical protein KHZ77_02360 [Veillonella sp.]|uniref:hypothetical protein n=1 Tax=Veillonella sp. TaxID=1926307 RepID=UPI0025FB224A|nr:hypothetical protein [Veillonella sp.]MBS4912989.1 hypothetical protein [Veillonella sp.]